MKAFKFFTVAALAAAVLSSCNSTPKIEGVELPSGAEIDSVSYLVGINFGYFLKANNFVDKLGDLNLSEMKKGMNDFINAEGDMHSDEFNASFKINPDQMNRLFDAYISKRNEYAAAYNKAEGEKFLENLYAKGDKIAKTESGLMYEVIEAGNDKKAVSDNDTVWVHYTGTLIDGTEFDKSDREGNPVQFVLSRVIKGWTEGMKLVGEGGKIKLYVPAELGYGERGAGGNIKPNSTLIFDVEITKVGNVAAAEEAAE